MSDDDDDTPPATGAAAADLSPASGASLAPTAEPNHVVDTRNAPVA